MSRWQAVSALRRRRWELKQEIERERSFPYYSPGGLGPHPIERELQDIAARLYVLREMLPGCSWWRRRTERCRKIRELLQARAFKVRCRQQEAILRACYVVPDRYPDSGVAWLCSMGGRDAHQVAAEHGLPRREQVAA